MNKKKMEQKMTIVEMRMLRCMCVVIKEDRIRNEHIRESVKTASTMGKMRENRLRWFGHVMRRNNSEAVTIVMVINVDEKSGKGRPKKVVG